jgi:small subunit ribosomal protein S20
MPVTKTAKRALRASSKKENVNKIAVSKLEIAVRRAKKSHSEKDILLAISLTDRASKKKILHPNKAARMKSSLSKLLIHKSKSPKKTKVSSKKK